MFIEISKIQILVKIDEVEPVHHNHFVLIGPENNHRKQFCPCSHYTSYLKQFQTT